MTSKQDRSTIDLADWKKRTRPAVANRAQYRCQSCGLFVGMHGDVDHVVPRYRCEAEGIHPLDPDNLQYLCKSCHSIKTNRERWDGHTPKDRQEVRRARVLGRGAFLAALQSTTSSPSPFHSKDSQKC